MNDTISLSQFNALDSEQAKQQLLGCCTAQNWASQLQQARPFKNVKELLKTAQDIWQTMNENELLEAFDGHPKIGDVNSLKEKYRQTMGSASHEQSGANNADEQILIELKELNEEYEKRFGFIFIVFATGKSAQQMLDILKFRISNTRQQELENAAAAQASILNLRLEKLIQDN